MAFEEEKEYKSMLVKLSKTCTSSYRILKTTLIALLVAWLVLLTLSVLAIFGFIPLGWQTNVSAISIIHIFANGLTAVLFLWLATLFFKDISSGSTPFNDIQANRIRNISLIIIVKVVLEAIFSVIIDPSFNTGALDVSLQAGVRSEEPTLGLNLELAIVAIFLYCLSKVFKYGSLLQKDKDDYV